MKICVCVSTYKRPISLGYLIRCFERQTYQDRQMVILDDAGQYKNQKGDRWELVSLPRRFRTLGEKRNAVVGLVASDAEAICPWDDDDLYLSWALEASVAALQGADWSIPSQVLIPRGDWTLNRHATGPGTFYHGGMAFRRGPFVQAGGYTPDSGPEDQGLFRRMEAIGARQADPLTLGYRPFYVWGASRVSQRPNISALGCNQQGYERLAEFPANGSKLTIQDPPWFNLSAATIHEDIHRRPF